MCEIQQSQQATTSDHWASLFEESRQHVHGALHGHLIVGDDALTRVRRSDLHVVDDHGPVDAVGVRKSSGVEACDERLASENDVDKPVE